MKRTPVVLGGPMPIGPKKNVRDEAACRITRGTNGEEVYDWRANRQLPASMANPFLYGRRPASEQGQPKDHPANDKTGYGDEF